MSAKNQDRVVLRIAERIKDYKVADSGNTHISCMTCGLIRFQQTILCDGYTNYIHHYSTSNIHKIMLILMTNKSSIKKLLKECAHKLPFYYSYVGNYKPISSSRYVNDCFEYVYHFTIFGNVKLDKFHSRSSICRPRRATSEGGNPQKVAGEILECLVHAI